MPRKKNPQFDRPALHKQVAEAITHPILKPGKELDKLVESLYQEFYISPAIRVWLTEMLVRWSKQDKLSVSQMLFSLGLLVGVRIDLMASRANKEVEDLEKLFKES